MHLLGCARLKTRLIKVILVVVEALTAESKPSTAVGERIFQGERHDLGTAAPLPTTVSSLGQGRVGGPVESSPMLIEPIGLGSTRFAEQLSPRFA